VSWAFLDRHPFYTLIGPHSIFSPVSWWLQTTADLLAGDDGPRLGGRLQSAPDLPGLAGVHGVTPRQFLLSGIVAYSSCPRRVRSRPFARPILLALQNFTIGHSHLAMYGFVPS